MNKSGIRDIQHNSLLQAGGKPLPAKESLSARLLNLWNSLPPRDDRPLLKYIVYRLEDPDAIAISAAKRKFLFYTTGILLFVVAISLSVLFIKKFFLPPDIYWVTEATHTLFETFSGFISIIIGMILSWEYSTSGKRNILFLACAFFSTGMLDFFHAFSNDFYGLFVWYHSSGAFLGGIFFLSSLFVHRTDKYSADSVVWIRRFSIFSGIFLILMFAFMSHTFYSFIPDVLSLSLPHNTHVSLAKGQFSTFIYAVDHTSCLLYLFAGILFVRGFLKSNDVMYLIFAISVLLFSVSELFFVFSKLWDPMWWYWHFIKVINSAGLLLGLAYGFTKTFYRLYTSKMQLASLLTKIEGKNAEIEKAYVTLKETQKYLNESEKLASIGKMAAMMAHEIRNPLCAISNSVGVLKKYTLSPEESTELLTLVENEMERLNKLTEDFLSFAKPSHLRKAETDLNALVTETLSLLNIEKTKPCGISFQKSFAPDTPLLMLDRDHMKQVFINILINSMQAMPQGGVITILTRYKKTEDEVEISFADTGRGMSEEVIPRVFQPFYTTKDKGLGLGLNIIHKIVKEHGGYILLSSKEGEGTQIKLSFPVIPHTVQPDTCAHVVPIPDAVLHND